MTEPAFFFSEVNQRQSVFHRRAFIMGGLTSLGLVALGAERRVVDPDQQVAGPHELKVADRDLADPSGNLGGQRREIGLQSGVIGPLRAGGADPVVPVDHHKGGKADRQDDGEEARHEIKQALSGAAPGDTIAHPWSRAGAPGGRVRVDASSAAAGNGVHQQACFASNRLIG